MIWDQEPKADKLKLEAPAAASAAAMPETRPSQAALACVQSPPSPRPVSWKPLDSTEHSSQGALGYVQSPPSPRPVSRKPPDLSECQSF